MAKKDAENAHETEQTGTETDRAGLEPAPTEDGQTGQEPSHATTERTFPNPCVYCGPSVKGVTRQFTTYCGGLPEEMQKLLRRFPRMGELIVAPAKIEGVRKRMETPGTAERALYQQLKQALGGVQ
jgi:hypothetical protein